MPDENSSFLQKGKIIALQNMQVLKYQLEDEQRKNEKLREEICQLKAELQQARLKLSDLQTRYDNLVMAGILSATEKDRQNAKRRLTEMVQEIDNCLIHLNQ